MVISKAKSFEDILKMLEGSQKVFLVGCNDCAALCQTGGEEQVKEMAARLTEAGKTVTGSVIPDAGCHVLDVKRLFRGVKEQLAEAEILLVMSCGVGTQTAGEATGGAKRAVPANETLFHGESLRYGNFEQRCIQCADCRLGETGNICPMIRCAKGLMNGPCGGVVNGKCEIDREQDCGWYLIYQALKQFGRLDLMKQIMAPRDWSKGQPRVVLERKPGGVA